MRSRPGCPPCPCRGYTGFVPIYEYNCRECGTRFEVIVRGQTTPECPGCHGTSLERAFSKRTELSPSHLATAGKRQILTRMLNNLRGIYQEAGDSLRERGVLERLAILNPQDDKITDALSSLRRGN